MAMLSFFASGFIYTTNSHENIAQAAQMNSDQAAVVNLAKQQLGKPYAWGATGPNSFDCSGLTQYVFAHAVGVNLPRVTWQQETVGKDVSLNALLPGDLLFWGSRGSTYHVAIYIGDGNMI
ncbi:C40 family peptidase [Lacticaseibacillus paracasei]|nr:C40 family peptidase [Lacticaseibacillus paracasei]